MPPKRSIETLAIHAGQPPDPSTGAVMTPIYQTTTYRQSAVGEHKGYEYARTGNPTRKALEDCLAALEGGSGGLAFASGMAAAAAVLHLLSSGDHVLAGHDLYGGTYRIFERIFRQLGLEFSYAHSEDPDDFLHALRDETRLVWLESPTNPHLRIADLTLLAQRLKAASPEVLIAVDNTFASPYLQQPLDHGADIVLHSTTKYLGGHSDAVGGALIVRDGGIAERLRFIQNAVGAVPGPMDCFLILRGIKTLPVRMDRHSANAQRVAEYLAPHEKVAKVIYPGLPSHPQHDLAKSQMRSAGGMVSFTVNGSADQARQVAEATNLFALAESLGGVESLIEIPAAMTHASVENSPLQVDQRLIRLSVGLENAQDLIDDLRGALDII